MKKTTILFLSVFLILSCKKDKNQEEVLTGVVSKGMVYVEDIKFKRDTLDYGEYFIDFNEDGENDFIFIDWLPSHPVSLFNPLKLQSNKISVYVQDLVISDDGSYYYRGFIKRLGYKEKIGSGSGFWSPLEGTYNSLPLRFNYFELEDAFRVNEGGYIGVRVVQGKDTLYGWINISDKLNPIESACERK
jgi:hypothetical protein